MYNHLPLYVRALGFIVIFNTISSAGPFLSRSQRSAAPANDDRIFVKIEFHVELAYIIIADSR